MLYRKTDEGIEISDVTQFNAENICECGQLFRYRKEGDCYTIFSKDKICLLQKVNDRVIIKSEDSDYFERYFDLNNDLNVINDKLSEDESVKKAVSYGKGLRILKQDPFETIISFIISANNNIPRIKKIIERICRELGEEKQGYYAFPTPERMGRADEAFYAEIGAGYRARYIAETVKALNNFDYSEIEKADTNQARKILTGFKGVGNKVADCILLFAFGKNDVFPMDTWTKRIYEILGFPEEKNPKKMAENLVKKFGMLSGYAQQYLYHYYRNN